MMTKTMALESATDNIRTNIVAPATTQTDLNRELRGNRSKESSNTNNSRNGYSTEEAANVVKFLA